MNICTGCKYRSNYYKRFLEDNEASCHKLNIVVQDKVSCDYKLEGVNPMNIKSEAEGREICTCGDYQAYNPTSDEYPVAMIMQRWKCNNCWLVEARGKKFTINPVDHWNKAHSDELNGALELRLEGVSTMSPEDFDKYLYGSWELTGVPSKLQGDDND